MFMFTLGPSVSSQDLSGVPTEVQLALATLLARGPVKQPPKTGYIPSAPDLCPRLVSQR